MSGPTNGYLLIADITGYTGYLTQTELDHAQGTLTDLLEVLLDQTRPPLVLSRLAGDAVVSYALGDAFATGQTFVELIENTYVAFRRVIDRMVLNNTCTCKACANIRNLDLKFFVHYGTFVRQQLSAHEELLGNDVNLLFRLTKNKVAEATGITAYALYTQDVMDRLGLDGITTGAMIPHRESYEHLGEVTVSIADMAGVWESRRLVARETLGPVLLESSIEIAVPPSVAWSSLANPEHVRKLLGAQRVAMSALAGGRLASGSEVHCHHGEGKTTVLTIVEWTPFERYLVQYAIPLPVGTAFGFCEYTLQPTEAGTRLTQRMTRPTGPWLARTLATLALKRMDRTTMNDMRTFKALVETQAARREPAPAAVIPTAEQMRDAIRSSLVSSEVHA